MAGSQPQRQVGTFFQQEISKQVFGFLKICQFCHSLFNLVQWQFNHVKRFVGGRFDSEDDDRTSEQSAPGVSDFKDDDDFRKSPRSALPRKPSGGGPADFASSKPAKPKARATKKVDLGAAAAFANKEPKFLYQHFLFFFQADLRLFK